MPLRVKRPSAAVVVLKYEGRFREMVAFWTYNHRPAVSVL
jgi:hypothetical protein